MNFLYNWDTSKVPSLSNIPVWQVFFPGRYPLHAHLAHLFTMPCPSIQTQNYVLVHNIHTEHILNWPLHLELFIWGVEWCKLPQTPRGNPYCFSLRSIEGLNGAHFFVFGSVYLIKTAFWPFLNILPDRFARMKIAIFAPRSLHLSFKKTAYWFNSMLIYEKSPES